MAMSFFSNMRARTLPQLFGDPSAVGDSEFLPTDPAADPWAPTPNPSGPDPMQYLGGSSGFDESTGLYNSGTPTDTRGLSLPAPAPTSTTIGADHLYTNDPTSAAYRGPATTPSTAVTSGAGSATSGTSLQQSFSTALSKLINGPSPQEAGQNVLSSAPVTAFNANAKRNEARDRQFLAERAAAGGYSGSGGFESGVLGLRSKTNEAMDRFAGEQSNIEVQGRRDELLRGLAMALQFGDSEAARALSRELGLAGLDVQRLGINTGRDTALDQLGYNYANLQNSMNQNTLASLFGAL